MTTKKQLLKISRTLSVDICDAVTDAHVQVANIVGEFCVSATIFSADSKKNKTLWFYQFLEIADNIKKMKFCRKILKDAELADKFTKGEING